MGGRSWGVPASVAVLLTAVVTAVLCTGCQEAAGGRAAPGPRGSGGSASGASSAPATPGYGAVFLGRGECVSRGREFHEAPCSSEKATALVLARYDGLASTGRGACPQTTDFVLHISESLSAADEDGDGEVSRGYACMRNLEPPHPGDPGGGGGPHTVVGDCVYTARKGQVKETACDGSGEHAPQYEVASAVARRAQCPPSTELFVTLGGERPVGCARRV
ncbi:hypothetical protein [Streptomyces chengmaiensis]|uniref:hypothetical protein n=1 Tax=Streptomyces chengmaiensis TaxID=3040919 RepID=UPI0037DA1E29